MARQRTNEPLRRKASRNGVARILASPKCLATIDKDASAEVSESAAYSHWLKLCQPLSFLGEVYAKQTVVPR